MTDGVDWLRVADAPRARTIAVSAPAEVGGFRFARVDDGVTDDGMPRVSPERGYVTDAAERERLLGFLTGGSPVLETDWYDHDHIDPSRQFAVRMAYRTDGTWVWNAAVEYYLRWHSVGVDPELRRWIVAHDYHATPVPDDVVERARRATDERLAVLRRQVAEARAVPAPTGDLTADTRRLLEALGWQPGRDVADRVQRWLARWVDELADLPFERDGYPRYEPIPAALAVLNEFGGLASTANGPGITSAQIPFRIFPTGSGDDLTQFAVPAQMLGELLDQRVFQVGEVERGMGALVVDERGRVFACGPVDLYLGRDIHEALTRMLTGIRAQRLDEVDL